MFLKKLCTYLFVKKLYHWATFAELLGKYKGRLQDPVSKRDPGLTSAGPK